MAGPETRTTAEIGSLRAELDLFSNGQEPRSELIEQNLYPPLPICGDTLVWGFSILRCAERLELGQVNCIFIPTCPPQEMLAMALKLENRPGRYSWPEKAQMRDFLLTPSNGEGEGPGPNLSVVFTNLSPLIEDRSETQLAERIEGFSALPRELKTLVAEGQVDLKSAVRVQHLPREVFSALQASSLTFSQRRQLLNEIFEVSRRSDLSPNEIRELTDRVFRDPQPVEAVHRMRFPVLTDLQQRYRSLKEELLKGSGVEVRAPRFFEGDAFTVEFDFNSGRSFERKLKALHSLEGRLDDFLQLLR
jgi:hypothetical protein